MRTRIAVLAALLCGLAALAAPMQAGAAPAHNRGLTIHAAPNPILAGDGVVIFGRLQGPDHGDQQIVLYHRINPAQRFTIVSRTTTDSQGYYEFTKAEGIVMTNRSWFVRGPNGTHSRTIREWVSALVDLNASKSQALTGQKVRLYGAIIPAHPFEKVLIQQQNSANGDGWHTIARTYTGRYSHFSVKLRFAKPGTHTLRAYFHGDRRNTAGASDSVTVTVQQKENPSFTLTTSQQLLKEGQSATLSGTLFNRGSTSQGESGQQLDLLGTTASGKVQDLGTTTTDSSGDYRFVVTPAYNTIYEVVTVGKPHRHSARLVEGVQDILTINESSDQATVGGSVTISGSVAPSKAGHVIFLQRLGRDGYWHDVEQGRVTTGSTYSFQYTFGHTGTVELRARIFGGPWNVGTASNAETVTVEGTSAVPSS